MGLLLFDRITARQLPELGTPPPLQLENYDSRFLGNPGFARDPRPPNDQIVVILIMMAPLRNASKDFKDSQFK